MTDVGDLPRPRTRRAGTPSLGDTQHLRREGEVVLVVCQPPCVAFALTIVFSPSPACSTPFVEQV